MLSLINVLLATAMWIGAVLVGAVLLVCCAVVLERLDRRHDRRKAADALIAETTRYLRERSPR